MQEFLWEGGYFCWEGFWKEDSCYNKYTGTSLTEETIEEMEARLGYALPNLYVELLVSRNGGKPIRDCYIKEGRPISRDPIVLSDYYVEIECFFGLGEEEYSIFGKYGNEYWYEVKKYPRDIGMIIGKGKNEELIYLDYRDCGKTGNPRVCICSAKDNYEVRVLEESFFLFLSRLYPKCDLDIDEYDTYTKYCECIRKSERSGKEIYETCMPRLIERIKASTEETYEFDKSVVEVYLRVMIREVKVWKMRKELKSLYNILEGEYPKKLAEEALQYIREKELLFSEWK